MLLIIYFNINEIYQHGALGIIAN